MKVVLIFLFLISPLFAMPDAEFISELQQYEPLAKPVHSWPWNRNIDEDVAVELARVFRSVGVRLGDIEAYEKAIDLNPEYIAINFGPFHTNGMIGSPKWNKSEWQVTDNKTIKYFSLVNTKFKEAAECFNNKIIILFDHENWPIDSKVTDKLNMLVYIARNHFPYAEIHFYNFNQYRLDKRISPVAGVVSDTAGCSLYYHPMSWENITRLNSTCEYNDEVIAWVAVGSQWQLFPNQQRVWCDSCAPDLTHTRRLANNLKARKKIKAIAMWPEVGDKKVEKQRDHILAFIQGMNDE